MKSSFSDSDRLEQSLQDILLREKEYLCTTPQLEQCFVEQEDTILHMMNLLVSQTPHGILELIAFCADFDVFEQNILEAIPNKKEQGKIKKHFNSLRIEIKSIIKKHQITHGEWKRFSWKNIEDTLGVAKRALHLRYGIPLEAPEKNTSEWRFFRDKIIQRKQKDFRSMALHASFGETSPFNSYKELLLAAYGIDYDLVESDFGKKVVHVLTWKSKEETLNNVQQTLLLQRNIPLDPPEKESEEWQNVRAKILKVRQDDFAAMKIIAAVARNKFFDNYKVLLVELYGEHYNFSTKDFVRKNKKRSK